MKYIFLLFSLSVTLMARENPFFPLNPSEDGIITTNIIDATPPLKRASLSLPSTARTIERVTIEYKNLDGSLATKTLQLHNTIDWHLPIFISQNYNLEYTKEKKQLKSRKKQHFSKLAATSFIKFYGANKRLKIVTKDKLLRHFLLVKPHRIVCDFQRDIDMRSYEKHLGKKSIFTSIRIGAHDKYYRVVIELDGFYRYSVQANKQGYLFTLK